LDQGKKRTRCNPREMRKKGAGEVREDFTFLY